MADSLRRRLERGPLALLLVVIGLLVLSMGFWGSRNFVQAFDRDLESRAWQLLVALGPEASAPGDLAEPTGDGLWFEVWDSAGVSLARSRSLGSTSLRRRLAKPSTTGPRFHDLELPDGRRGRAVQLETTAFGASSPPRDGAPAMAVVLRSRSGLDGRLATLWGALLVGLLGGLAALSWAARRLVRRGLEPVAELARDLERIDLDLGLGRVRADLDGGHPAELQPLAEGLGRLLDHLERALERERRWSNDVAHELRTPIAELRTLAEVARRGPSTGQDEFFDDAREIALQMEGIVTQLLQMARSESGLDPVAWETVSWCEVFDAAWAPLVDKARGRDLVLEQEIPQGLLFDSDPIKLRLVLSNLLGNAVAHSPPGSTIHCLGSSDGPWLEIANPAPELRPQDLGSLFDRFWRKDPARTGSLHAGLGLSLARALADRLALDIEPRLEQGHLVLRLVPGGAEESGRRPTPRPEEVAG